MRPDPVGCFLLVAGLLLSGLFAVPAAAASTSPEYRALLRQRDQALHELGERHRREQAALQAEQARQTGMLGQKQTDDQDRFGGLFGLDDHDQAVVARMQERERQDVAAIHAKERQAMAERQRQEIAHARADWEAALERQAEQEAEAVRARELEMQQELEAARQRALQEEAAALEARQEQQRQEAQRLAETERQRLAALQKEHEFTEARDRVRQLALGFGIFALVLPCIPAYRLYAPIRFLAFREWAFKGRFLLSCVALGLFTWNQMEGIRTTGQAFWTLVFGALAIPAAFFLPGLVLLFGQYLHYLCFPHPARRFLEEIGRSRQPRPDDLDRLADSFYDPGRDGIFEEWRARNAERQARTMADMLRQQNSVIDEVIKNQRKKADLDD
jgi:hypothetical protein